MRARSLVFAAAVLLGTAGCASFNAFTTDSHSLSRPITIDGMTDDWPGEMYVVPNERMLAGFQNDGAFLYFALVVEDAPQRFQIVSGGLTVWFDPKGGKEKTFGIRYPIGVPEKARRPAKNDPQGEGLTMPDLPDGALSELEIVRSPKEPPQRLPVSDAKGLELKVAPGTGLLVYEMKIPLAADPAHPIAVGAKPGTVVGIGFETDKPSAASVPRGEEGLPGGGYGGRGGTGGGMGGRGGYGGSGGGMGGRGAGMMSAEPVKIWALVQLAPAKTPAPAPAASVRFLPGLLLTQAPAPAPKPADVAGVWVVTMMNDSGEAGQPLEWTFTQDKDTFKVKMASPFAPERTAEGTIKGRDLAWEVPLGEGGAVMTIGYKARVDGEAMSGEVWAGGMQGMTFSGKRKK